MDRGQAGVHVGRRSVPWREGHHRRIHRGCQKWHLGYKDGEEEAGHGGQEPDQVEQGELGGLAHEEGGEELTQHQAQGVGHPQDQGGDGSLLLTEPVLAHLGGDAGDEGAAHPRESLAEDRQQEGRTFGPPELASPDPRECGQAAESPAHCCEPGAEDQAQPQTSPLHQVDGQQTEGDTQPVGDHGDQVHLGPRHLVVLRPDLGHGGECDPVAVVGEVEQGDGDQEQPAGAVQPVLPGTLTAATKQDH